MERLKKSDIEIIRHFLSSIAYRFKKAINNCPEKYIHLKIGKDVRTPAQILNHITHVLLYAKSELENKPNDKIKEPPILKWEEEINRFYALLNDIDKLLENTENIELEKLKIILQGPLSDVMTHIGQLAMLRRMADDPIVKENFMKAKIDVGGIFQEDDS